MTSSEHRTCGGGESRALVAELRAVTTALRLGGLDTLKRATITRTENGAVLTLATAQLKETSDGR